LKGSDFRERCGKKFTTLRNQQSRIKIINKSVFLKKY
jgi:hypothetical protein